MKNKLNLTFPIKRKGFKKCSLFVLSLGLLSTSLFTVFSNKTQAFSVNTPTCDLGSWNWQQALETELGHAPTNDDKFIITKNTISASNRYVIFYIPTGTTGKNLDIYDNGGGDYGMYINAKRALYDSSTNQYLSTSDHNFSENPSCISYVNNPTMDNTNGAFPTYDFSPPPTGNFDDVIRVTETLNIECFDSSTGTSLNENIDFERKWSELLQQSVEHWNNDQTLPITRQGGDSILYTTVWDTLQLRLNEGKGWGIEKSTETSQDGDFFNIYVQTDTQPLFFEDLIVGTEGWKALLAPTAYKITVSCNQNGVSVYYGGAPSEQIIQRNGNIYRQLLFYTGDVTYPENYNGTLIPQTSGVDKTVLRPDFKWNVVSKTLKVTEISDPPDDIGDWKVRFIINLGTIDGTNNLLTYEKVLSSGETLTIDFPRLDNVGIQAFFVDNDNNLKPDTDDYDFRETDVSFILDGSAFSGTTKGRECDENDYCTQPDEEPLYEDCSQYDLQVSFWNGGVEFGIPTPATVACWARNVWTGIIELFKFLFFDWDDNGELKMPWSDFQTNTHGLTAIFSAPLQVFYNMNSQNYTCSAKTLPYPIIGGITLPCMYGVYNNMFGSMFALYQTIASGVICYFILVRYFELIKGFKDPHNDRIEVYDL